MKKNSNKNVIRLNEATLREIVAKCVNEALDNGYGPEVEQGWREYVNNEVDGIPELDANMNVHDTRDMASAYAKTGLDSVKNVNGPTLHDRLKSDWGNGIEDGSVPLKEGKMTMSQLKGIIMESVMKVLKDVK